MHELSVAQALVETASRELERAGAVRAVKLVCRVGDLCHIDDTLLREAFEVAATGSPCAGAELVVERCYLQARCPACQRVFAVRQWNWLCPACGAEGRLLGGGDELTLLSIEAEQPEPAAAAGGVRA